MDFISILILVVFCVHTGLLFILFSKRKEPTARCFITVLLTVMLWTIAMFFYRISSYAETQIWVRVLYVMPTLIPTSFLYFVWLFPEGKQVVLNKQVILTFANLSIIVLVLIPGAVIRGVRIPLQEEKIILWGHYYFVYVLYISCFFLAGLWILLKKLKRSEGLLREQFIYIFLGFGASIAIGTLTNLFLVWFGYFNFNWVGQVGSVLMTSFITYAIVKHKLMDIKIFTVRIFIFLLLVVYIFDSFVFIGNETIIFNKVALRIFGFILFCIFSALLARSVKKEVAHREQLARLSVVEEANEKLMLLDRQKTEFLNIAAHQLRTPVSIINNYISMLVDGDYGAVNEEVKQVHNNIGESNQWLVRLADEFLNIANLEQGRLRYRFEEVNLIQLIDSVVKELKCRAESRGLKLVWDSSEVAWGSSPLQLKCDLEKIRNVIFNFVDNAIKYSETGEIRVEVEEEQGEENEGRGVSARVIDQGMGFSADDNKKLFQKFQRGANAHQMEVNTSMGLGLYIAKKFIEGHDGCVWAKSEGEGRGSEFGFWLPLKQ